MSGRIPSQNETNISKVVAGVRDLFFGRSAAVNELTLGASATTTTVLATNCGPDSRIALTPRTANAAAALGTTYIPKATTVEGQFVIHHANNAQTDRTFGYAIIG
ncbi:MAG: hypothetical protein Q7T86_03130 [Hyphomicrobiaceae bacterium]|nr:hypothetical protein [Hyphomicrobiaceae bacterium]